MALAREIQKNGGKITNDLVDKSLQKAKENTYKQANAFASGVSGVQTRLRDTILDKNNPLVKRATAGVGYFTLKGIMPFVRTPLNIAYSSLEYSPLNAIAGISQTIADISQGEKPTVAFDRLTKGLTGSSIALLGWFLSELGLITNGGDDEEKKDQFDKANGIKNYSLKIGDYYYPLEWLGPVAVQLFLGAEINTNRKDVTLASLGDSFASITEPLVNMTILKGVNSALASASYDKNSKIAAIFTSSMNNYLGQFVPSIAGSIARTIDGTQRQSYYDKNDKILPKATQDLIQKQQAKFPFLSKGLMPKYDQFGNKNETSLKDRIIQNFFSPSYYSKKKDDFVKNEIEKLYDETKENAVLPSYLQKSVTVDKQTKDLNRKEYEQALTESGKNSYSELENFFKSDIYKKIDNNLKIKTISKIYEYYKNVAKTKVSDYKLNSEDAKITLFKENGFSPYEYLTAKELADINKNNSLTKAEIFKYSKNFGDRKQAYLQLMNRREANGIYKTK
jgi:hypothetical protein